MNVPYRITTRLTKIVLIATSCVAVGLAVDYFLIRHKESQIIGVVSDCGGKCFSIPVWPLGTEYRISFSSPLTAEQILDLAPLNHLRGSVSVAFPECAFPESEALYIKDTLHRCRLFSLTEDNHLVRFTGCADQSVKNSDLE